MSKSNTKRADTEKSDKVLLMIKKHMLSGKKYLCKCSNSVDPYKYKGSGKYWRRIIQKYDDDYIITCVIGKFINNEDLREVAEPLSRELNVVESKEWANLIPEIGDGGPTNTRKRARYNMHTGARRFFLDTDPAHIAYLDKLPQKFKNKGKKQRIHHIESGRHKLISVGSEVPIGWAKGGAKKKYNYGPKSKTRVYHKKGHKKIYLPEGVSPPEGWKRGTGKGSTTGKKRYHDPVTKKTYYLDEKDHIPNNLIKGSPRC